MTDRLRLSVLCMLCLATAAYAAPPQIPDAVQQTMQDRDFAKAITEINPHSYTLVSKVMRHAGLNDRLIQSEGLGTTSVLENSGSEIRQTKTQATYERPHYMRQDRTERALYHTRSLLLQTN